MTTPELAVALKDLDDGRTGAWTALAEELERQNLSGDDDGSQVWSRRRAAAMMDAFLTVNGTSTEPLVDFHDALTCLMHAGAMLFAPNLERGENETLTIIARAREGFSTELNELL